MRERIRLLSLVVGNTVTLLALAAALVVIGIFNASLGWDIFGPKAEAVLYGVFGSCIALAVIGVAMTVVLGVQEIVRSFKVLETQKALAGQTPTSEATSKTYARIALGLVLALTAAIASLAITNHRVQAHRSEVYKRLANEQMQHFEPQLTRLLASITAPPRNNVPPDLHDLMQTLAGLSFMSKATIYVPDSQDKSAMWGYTAWRGYDKRDGFARFFVAKDFEKAMRKALDGDNADLDAINRKVGFEFYHVVRDAHGAPAAILRLDGNNRENFRDYALGS